MLRKVVPAFLSIWHLSSSSPKNFPNQRPYRFRHRTKPLGLGGEQPVIECAFACSDTVSEILPGHVQLLHRITQKILLGLLGHFCTNPNIYTQRVLYSLSSGKAIKNTRGQYFPRPEIRTWVMLAHSSTTFHTNEVESATMQIFSDVSNAFQLHNRTQQWLIRNHIK